MSTYNFAELLELPTSGAGTSNVRWLQDALNRALGLRLSIDGNMGPQTRGVVRQFQQRAGLVADGIPGPKTVEALRKALAGGGGGGGFSSGPPSGSRTCSDLTGASVALDDFVFDRTQLPAKHRNALADIARCVLASHRTRSPIKTLLVVGHTDPVGTDDYNSSLGQRRADDTKKRLVEALENIQPGSSRRVMINTTSRGEKEAVAGSPSRSRRVNITVNRTRIPKPPSRIPSDPQNGCGVPNRASSNSSEIYQLEEVGARQQVSFRPVLSLFQNHREARNHFHCSAVRIDAINPGSSGRCRSQKGPVPYDTGSDIVNAITRASRCLNKPVEVVHIFSHSGDDGVYGRSSGKLGLYKYNPSTSNRRRGARSVRDIPRNLLSQNVVFIFHGCNTAHGTDNIARSLYEHLSKELRSPTVFGHPSSVCAGQDNNWREYSNRSKTGQITLKRVPNYDARRSRCC